MPVVKAQQSFHLRQSAVVMDLADMEREGERLVGEAKKRADEFLAQARATAQDEATMLREEARKAGQTEGYEAGFAEGSTAGHDEAVGALKEKLTKLVERWSGTLESLESKLPTHLAEAKTDLVKLAITIAAKVIKQEALKNREVVKGNVEAALALVGAGRAVTAHVHPEEVAVLEKYVPELLGKMRQITALEIKADETLGPGDCLLHFGGGEVDGRLEEQQRKIAAELLVEDVIEPPRHQGTKQ